jgi:hypothetical protein
MNILVVYLIIYVTKADSGMKRVEEFPSWEACRLALGQRYVRAPGYGIAYYCSEDPTNPYMTPDNPRRNQDPIPIIR